MQMPSSATASAFGAAQDIVVDGGWFTAAPYLGNERSRHMLSLLKKKGIQGFFRRSK
ncbi:hypothetical protein [Nonomuraea sp. NPDC049758]|uniref:hypothetical protein n=1 Tax=Nonomuraea sp. NPDC049758 TaxID=3154360 RepID=UPI003434A706